jgi:hypothetical protein
MTRTRQDQLDQAFQVFQILYILREIVHIADTQHNTLPPGSWHRQRTPPDRGVDYSFAFAIWLPAVKQISANSLIQLFIASSYQAFLSK